MSAKASNPSLSHIFKERMKISYLKEKLILTAAYLAFVFIWWWLGLPCIWKALFGIICPGCGMTRATLAVLRFDLLDALRLHPMVWSMPILYLYFLFDKGLFRKKAANRLLLFAIGAGFLIQWAWKLLG